MEDEPKTVSILIKCSPAWRAEVRQAAKSAGMSASEYIRKATEKQQARK